ncbi:hypothetical protein PV08_04053 [Exophiala spinifera]|uniref:Uncharacterized protein n=1 Tax=Exophiala spinifera TaxID=91928 RepID=A0A0D2BD15_9EURO|nr:uncharacterized protein PV08_04053 [Exophiala spinifera]KIW16863.1 hypothetical protein PV08_04053 [Exophiala spinifera]
MAKATPPSPRNFQFRRLLDNLEYKFHRQTGLAKDSVYVRSDMAVRVIYDLDFGWSIWADGGDGDNHHHADGADDNCLSNPNPPPRPSRRRGSLVGRVWDVPVKDQGDHPPIGVWVSRKGDKSYVYLLEYLD